MHCLCEVLDPAKYALEKPVAILEDKKALLSLFGIPSDFWLNMFQFDNRLLTVCFESHDLDFLRFIVVYDYPHFCSDNEIKEAIIFHELGHIQHPVSGKEINHQAEISCDQHAVIHGHVNGVKKVLAMLSRTARTMNSPLLLEAAELRTKALNTEAC
ncbi:hypothetical protein [Bacillus sp. FJAT-27251]|uniref:hypothetical protein n=1 Tax=Bacillus sp. FJAT-27251 TaxID=1684142 RepID=UPI0006A7CD8D|nr:hypothetical protein [Bacillus sp. FJAT-27251]